MTATGPGDRQIVDVPDRAAWRAWLEANHATSPSVWLVFGKGDAEGLRYAAAVEEALAFGWIDSTGNKLDETRWLLLMAPRKPGSGWSKVNKARLARLEAAGRLHPSGIAAIDTAKADGSWTKLDAVHEQQVPDDLAAALAAAPDAARHFEAFPPGARKQLMEWVIAAKRPETRARRVAEVVHEAAENRRANQWRPKGEAAA